MKTKAKKIAFFCEKVTDIYIYFIIVALSLFCFPNYSFITASKFELFSVSTAIFALIMIIGNAELKLVGIKSDFSLSVSKLKSLPVLAVGAFLICCILSFIFSEHRSFAFIGAGKYDGLLSDLLYAFVFIVVAVFGKFKYSYVSAFTLVVWINFVLSILQFFGANPLFLYPKDLTYHDAFKQYANEFLGTFGNVDVLSAFLAVVIPIFIMSAINCKNRIRYLYLISVFPAALLLVLCKVNAGILGVLASVAVAALFVLDIKDYKIFSASLLVLIFGALSAIILRGYLPIWVLVFPVFFCGFTFSPKSFSRKLFLIALYFLGSIALAVYLVLLIKNGDADSGRFRIWRDALRIFRENPLLGCGPDAYLYESSFEFERYDASLDITIKSAVDCAHNIYLNMLSCTGILSLSAFTVFIVSVLKKSLKSPLFPAIIAFLVQGFFSFEVCSVSAIFYIICGLAVCDNIKIKDVRL